MTYRRMKGAAMLALAMMVAGATSCRTLGRQAMANPVVEVKDVVVRGIGAQGGSLDVILNVYNPNEFRMDATKISYELVVDSIRVANGEITKLVTLEQRSHSDITVPVNFTYNEIRVVLEQFMARGVVDYLVRGEFTVVTPFGNLTRPYSGTGRLNSMP